MKLYSADCTKLSTFFISIRIFFFGTKICPIELLKKCSIFNHLKPYTNRLNLTYTIQKVVNYRLTVSV